MSERKESKEMIVLWKGSFIMFILAILLLLTCIFLPWHNQEGSITDIHGNTLRYSVVYTPFGRDTTVTLNGQSASSSEANIGGMGETQFTMLVLGVSVCIIILLILFLLIKMGKSNGEDGKMLGILVTVFTLIVPILALVLLAGKYKDRSTDYGTISESPGIGIFILFIVFIFMIIAVVKWKAIDIKEIQRTVTPAHTRSTPIQPQPYIPRNPPIISTPTATIENELNLLLNSNLSRDAKEKSLLKLYLDNKITKKQFYDMKGRL